MKLTVKDCYKIREDFENVFLSKSEIHVLPKYDRLKLASRSVSSTRYDDVYIIEPKSYYYIELNEYIDQKHGIISIDDSYYNAGLIISSISLGKRVYIYNATENIIYIEKGAKVGELIGWEFTYFKDIKWYSWNDF